MRNRLNFTLFILVLICTGAKAQTYPVLSQQSATHYVVKDTLFKVPFISLKKNNIKAGSFST